MLVFEHIGSGKTVRTHPVAQLFPILSDSELSEMAESIRREGLLNPCVRQGEVLLDGRNRIAACKLAGIEPRFIEYTGDSPVSFIIGANLARRHLDKGQKIALAIEIEPHFAEEAAKRKATSGPGVYGGKPLVENVPQAVRAPKSRDQAARTVGVSGKLVSAAKAIKAADPGRFEKVGCVFCTTFADMKRPKNCLQMMALLFKRRK